MSADLPYPTRRRSRCPPDDRDGGPVVYRHADPDGYERQIAAERAALGVK